MAPGSLVAAAIAEPQAALPKLERPLEGVPVEEELPPSELVAKDEDDESENWEDEDDGLDDDEPYAETQNEYICTVEEALAYRRRLHEAGPDRFIRETVTDGKVTARKLLTAFNVRAPIKSHHDQNYYQYLGMAIGRELAKRRRLDQYNTLDDVAQLLRTAKNIMVITGAGISTSLGIPDFRSKNTGFYERLRARGFDDPQEVFDIEKFDEDPSLFYDLVSADLVPDRVDFSPTHAFIKLLQDKGKLMTNYTQNIDNIERNAGIDESKLIQCHGSWNMATCRKCRHKVDGRAIFADVKLGKVVKCRACLDGIEAQKTGNKRKTSSNGQPKAKRWKGDDSDEDDGRYDIPEPGVMKPDITFFGEALPKEFFDRLRDIDRFKTDLVIVIGTSMKVAPVSEIPNVLGGNIPQIYISRDPVYHINFDITLLGECDLICAELAKRAGWELKHPALKSVDDVEVQPYQGFKYMHTVKANAGAPDQATNGAHKDTQVGERPIVSAPAP